MSKVVKHLGIDEEDVKWYHLAACRGMPVNWFFDDYENDKQIAKQVDQICLSCPVAQICLDDALTSKQKYGVWGGIYLSFGKTSKSQNKHKTPEVWKKLKEIHGKSII